MGAPSARTLASASSRRATLPTGHKRLGPHQGERAQATALAGRKYDRGEQPGFVLAVFPARLSVMETRRWTNPSQPQTLYLAVVLFYINAVMSLIFGNYVEILFGFLGVLGFIIGSVAAGSGIAQREEVGLLPRHRHRSLPASSLPVVDRDRWRRRGVQHPLPDRGDLPGRAVRPAGPSHEPGLPAHLVPLTAFPCRRAALA